MNPLDGFEKLAAVDIDWSPGGGMLWLTSLMLSWTLMILVGWFVSPRR